MIKEKVKKTFEKWFDKEGREHPDPTPVAMPIGFEKPESLEEKIRRLTRNEAAIMAQARGQETFEEADDFDVEDDEGLPGSPWENEFDPEMIGAGRRREFQEEKPTSEAAGKGEDPKSPPPADGPSPKEKGSQGPEGRGKENAQ